MINRLRLEGKVALITGGASAARLFLKNGARADVQDDLAHKVITSCTDPTESGKICYFRCDVRDEKQVEDAVNHTVAKYGTLDILFSNAGIIGPLTALIDMDLDAFDNTMHGNQRRLQPSNTCHDRRRYTWLHNMHRQCGGGGAGPHAYTTSKHAMVGLMRTACSELGGHGIRVNCVSPFGLGTPLSCACWNKSQVQLITDAAVSTDHSYY